jgi:hypothetical protein
MVPPHDPQSAATAAGKRENPLSPIDEGGFPLTGTSELPDPSTHAYRKDLADVALAGRVVASHYAEPLARRLTEDVPLLSSPDDGAQPIATLKAGDSLRILDNSRGWAWGYAPDGRVGYVRASAVGA